jgi:hypothetical protein
LCGPSANRLDTSQPSRNCPVFISYRRRRCKRQFAGKESGGTLVLDVLFNRLLFFVPSGSIQKDPR